jgi:hypothetical protein
VALAACLAVRALERAVHGTRLQWIAAFAVVALLVPPALRSGRLVEGLRHDTRVQSDRWLEEHAQKPIVELYASGRPYDIVSLATLDLEAARRAGTTHVAASSFLYDRFARGSRLAGQKDYVYTTHEKYQELFSYPYVEFRPETPTFAFSNPTIRVVDIRRGALPLSPRGKAARSLLSPLADARPLAFGFAGGPVSLEGAVPSRQSNR